MSGTVSSLASVSTLITKGTTPTTLGYAHSGSGIPFLRVQNIFGGQVNFEEDTLFIGEDTHAALKRSQIQGGDVLVTIAGTIGRTGVVPLDAPSMNCNQAVAIVRPTAQIERSYLRHWLESQAARSQMIGSTVTGTISNLSLTQLGELKVPLPPLEEQRRIAAILDQSETLRTQRRQALAHLDTLTRSLFLDMFGDPVANPKGFQTKSLGEVATFYGGNSLPSGTEYSDQVGGYFFMKVSDMNLLGNEREIHRCQSWSEVAGSKASTCPVGSIVVPKRGGAIGTNKKRITTRLTVLDPNLMAIFPAPNQLNQEFLFQWFLGFDLASIASGSSVPQLNKQDLEPLLMLVPPLPLQQTFATRIQAIEALKATHRTALAQLDALFASLQQRAFAGELTAQASSALAAPPAKRSFAELGQLDAPKGVESLIYAAKRLPGKGHYWPTKVQYFADKRHLARYGHTLYGETHVAMPYGPVPQAAFNASRALAKNELISEFPIDVVRAALRREGEQLIALRDADTALLGAQERESLEWAIRYVRDMNFEQLKAASHDAAWQKTVPNAAMAWRDIIATLEPEVQERLLKKFE